MRRFVVIAISCAVLGLATVPGSADAPASAELGPIGGAAVPIAESISSAAATPFALTGYRATSPVRVLLVSSGVDTSVLPAAARDRIAVLSDPNLPAVGGDRAGYGTYAASVLLQAAEGASITSVGVYDANGRTQPKWIWYALWWASQHAGDFDVVLSALPPGEMLDPITAAMATGEWSRIVDAMGNRPLPAAPGPVLGVPLRADLMKLKVDQQPWRDASAVQRFAYVAAYWDDLRARIRALSDAGVGVVAPAGDHGPRLQTLLGMGNLPEVVAVGGANGGAVSARSSSGPSIDLRAKPDLVAPTGVVGLLPPGSLLAKAAASSLDRQLEPEWPFGTPATDARARLDTSLTSAALVAAAMGGMAAGGVRDVARQRGALTAAAVPLPGVPVWRQGAGVLRTMPDAGFAASRPLVVGPGDLGLEPDAGEWSASVPVVQGDASSARVALTDFAGAALDGQTTSIVTDIRRPDVVPAVEATVAGGTVTLAAPPGDNPWPAGLYCGYMTVTLPAIGADEDVPMCLTEGTSVRAQAFYIHNDPAPDTSFGFFPSLPPGAGVLDHPLHMLPVNPLGVMLYGKATDASGDARFHNILPGLYTVKEFADYGSPVVQRGLEEYVNGVPVARELAGDIGANPAYQAMQALVLPPATQAECSAASRAYPCDHDLLTSLLGPDVDERTDESDGAAFVWEHTKFAYLAGPRLPDGSRLRIVKGCDNPKIPEARREPQSSCFKKSIGTAVTSRYVDIVPQADLGYESVGASTPLAAGVLSSVRGSPNGTAAWRFSDGGDPGTIVGTYDPAAAVATSTAIGIAAYPFNLSQPNYSAHMSLNFAYELRNALLVGLVAIGEEARTFVVAPNGTYTTPSANASTAFDPASGDWLTLGYGKGNASFDMRFLPRGAGEGVLFLALLPSAVTVSGVRATTVAAATVSALSFELDTWTPADWPARRILSTGTNGHSFTVDSRFGAPRTSLAKLKDVFGEFTRPQIADPPLRRVVDTGVQRAEVIEDWTMIVHSPGDDARIVELCDTSAPTDGVDPTLLCSGTTKTMGTQATPSSVRIARSELAADAPDTSLPPAGREATLFDPRRGIQPFAHPLAFSCTLDDVWAAAGVTLPRLATNGRFWEAMRVPAAVLRAHARAIEIHIEDEPDPSDPWSSIAYGRSGTLKGDPSQEPLVIPVTPGDGPSITHVAPDGGSPVEVSPYLPFLTQPIAVQPQGWSLWTSLGGTGSSDPDAASWGPGQLDEFVRGTDNALYYRRLASGKWSNWASIGYPSAVVKVSSAPGAVSWVGGRTDVFAAGDDRALWRRAWDNGRWSAWESLGGPCAAAGVACGVHGGPDAATRGPGRIDVAVRGLDGAVWLRSFAGGSWSVWSSVGAPPAGMADTDPALVSPDGERLDVLVRGSDDALWRRGFDGSAWDAWERVGGTVTASPDAASREPGTFDVFVRGPGDGLWTVRRLGDHWSAWQTLGGVLTSGPGAAGAADRLDVVVIGQRKDVWHRFWSPEGVTLGA